MSLGRGKKWKFWVLGEERQGLRFLYINRATRNSLTGKVTFEPTPGGRKWRAKQNWGERILPAEPSGGGYLARLRNSRGASVATSTRLRGRWNWREQWPNTVVVLSPGCTWTSPWQLGCPPRLLIVGWMLGVSNAASQGWERNSGARPSDLLLRTVAFTMKWEEAIGEFGGNDPPNLALIILKLYYENFLT